MNFKEYLSEKQIKIAGKSYATIIRAITDLDKKGKTTEEIEKVTGASKSYILGITKPEKTETEPKKTKIVKLVHGYWEDKNGNKWSKSVGEWDAEKYSKSLKNCTDCTNCINCTDCKDCISCFGCEDCLNCRYSNYCIGCRDCDSCIKCDNCMKCDECKNCDGCSHCVKCTDVSDLLNKSNVNGGEV